MAVSVNQGYVRSFNLSETPDEVLTIDNLGGGSISTDLKVFAANTKNVSRIIYKPGLDNFSVTETGGTTLFTFDLLSCYGNGDPIKVKIGRTINNIEYNYANDELELTFNQVHSLTNNDIGETIRIIDSYFDGLGTLFFNEKDFKIKSIASTTSVVLGDVGWSALFEDSPGTYDPTADLPIGQDVRYPFAITTSFSLPTPLAYDQQYYVVLTNGINKFKIATSYTRGQLVNPILLTESVDHPLIFERSNAVTQQNLINLSVPEIFDTDVDGGADGIYFNGVLGRGFNDNFDYLENILDSANYFRLKKYARSINNVFAENPIKLEGNLRTIDPDNFNSGTEEIFAETSPGVFILDPNSTREQIIKLRSFSDNTSPWELNTGNQTLEYSAASITNAAQQEMSIGNMILKGDPISLDNIQGVVVEVNNYTPSQKFTHKLPVIINGEEYNVLLTDSIA
jgi:hypothetical protein